tara:strand:- start:624 stop:791 length:168 start_codon:yes stop_codon:yes gene_type:complete
LGRSLHKSENKNPRRGSNKNLFSTIDGRTETEPSSPRPAVYEMWRERMNAQPENL